MCVDFVLLTKQLIIFSSLAPWRLICGVLSVQFLVFLTDLLVLHSIFGGLIKSYLLDIICTLLALLLFAGPFGKLEIRLALRTSLFPLLLT
jgi:hypothetical protein